MALVIRRAIAADAAAVADVWLRSFRSTYAFPPAHSNEEVRAWVRDHLVPGAETWVAVEDAGVVGLLSLSPGWVDQLYVDPSAQGRGLGRALLVHAMRRQPDGLELRTFQANERARRFYARNGFAEVELTDGAGNDERQPDVRLRWIPASSPGRGPTPAARSRPTRP